MVPAALPAFSAPVIVRVVHSLASSAAESSAAAGVASTAPTASAAQVFLVMNPNVAPPVIGVGVRGCLVAPSERIAHGNRVEVAILEGVRARAPARGLPRRDRAARGRLVRASVGTAAEV